MPRQTRHSTLRSEAASSSRAAAGSSARSTRRSVTFVKAEPSSDEDELADDEHLNEPGPSSLVRPAHGGGKRLAGAALQPPGVSYVPSGTEWLQRAVKAPDSTDDEAPEDSVSQAQPAALAEGSAFGDDFWEPSTPPPRADEEEARQEAAAAAEEANLFQQLLAGHSASQAQARALSPGPRPARSRTSSPPRASPSDAGSSRSQASSPPRAASSEAGPSRSRASSPAPSLPTLSVEPEAEGEAESAPESSPEPEAPQRPHFDFNAADSDEEDSEMFESLKALLASNEADEGQELPGETYEEMRQRKLRANEALLEQLGLGTAAAGSRSQDSPSVRASESVAPGEEETPRAGKAGRRGRPPKATKSTWAEYGTYGTKRTLKVDADGTTTSRPLPGTSLEIAFVDPPVLRERARQAFVYFAGTPIRAPTPPPAPSESEGESEVEVVQVAPPQPKWQRRTGPVGEADTIDGTTCHQCRRKTAEEKMRCRFHCEGEVCPLFYCRACLLVRYRIEADFESRSFVCPRCKGLCNCSMCLRARGLEELLQIRDGDQSRAMSLSNMLRNPDGSIKHRSVHEYLVATYGLEKIQGPTGFAAPRRPSQKKVKVPKAAAKDGASAKPKTPKGKENAEAADASAATPKAAKQSKASLKAEKAAAKAKEKEEARAAREAAKQQRIKERDAPLASVKAGIAARKRGVSPSADVAPNGKRRKLGNAALADAAANELEQLQREMISLQAALVLNQTDDDGRRVGHFTFQAKDDAGVQVKRTLVIRLSPASSASDDAASSAQPSRAASTVSSAADKAQTAISAMAEARKAREQNVWVKGAADQSDSDSDMSDLPDVADVPEAEPQKTDSPLSSAPPSRSSSRESSPASSRGPADSEDGDGASSSSSDRSALLAAAQPPPLAPTSPTLHPSFTLEASVSPARPPHLPEVYGGSAYSDSATAPEHSTLAALQNMRSTQWGFAAEDDDDDASPALPGLLDAALRSSSFPLHPADASRLDDDLPDAASTLTYNHHPHQPPAASQDSDAASASGSLFPRHASPPPLLHSAFRNGGGPAAPAASISYPASPHAFLDGARTAAAASAPEGHSS